MSRYSTHLPANLETPIWRYLDFTKFVSMLDKNALFFCRPDCLDDRFEGTWGSASIRSIEDKIRGQQATGGAKFGDVDFQINGVKRNFEWFRQIVAVNCWHMNEHESEAMWKIYIRADQGIAIRSTITRLAKSFPDDPKIGIHLGCVTYIDYDVDPIPFDNYVNALIYKRKDYDHERELRALAGKMEITISPRSYSERVTG